MASKKKILAIIIMTLLGLTIAAVTYFGFMGPTNEYGAERAFSNVSFTYPTGFYQTEDAAYNFVIEQTGKVKIFDNDPDVEDTQTVIDIEDRVFVGSEDGLLGFALHPNFTDNGLIYTYHSEEQSVKYGIECESETTKCIRTALTEYYVDPSSLDNVDKSAVAASARELFEFNHTSNFHRGGDLKFGPNGYLHIFFGDSTTPSYVQRLDKLNGAILRIDVNNQDPGLNYSIPESNPFAGQNNTRGEIWAYGLRNPWRGNFDPVTGNLWVGDVGLDDFEEINVVTAGGNYGWPMFEGDGCRVNTVDCNGIRSNVTFPVFSYKHPNDVVDTFVNPKEPWGVAVIGGFVYRGAEFEDLQGKYIFADYNGGVWQMTFDPDTYEMQSVNFMHHFPDYLSSIGTDQNNELYFTGIYRGGIFTLDKNNPILFYGILTGYFGTIAALVWYDRRNGAMETEEMAETDEKVSDTENTE